MFERAHGPGTPAGGACLPRRRGPQGGPHRAEEHARAAAVERRGALPPRFARSRSAAARVGRDRARRALELGYDRVAALTALSRSLSGQDKHQRCSTSLRPYRRERGSELPPELLTMQATAQLALGQVAQATASLNAALQQAPTTRRRIWAWAWVATAASDTDATLRHIEEAIRHRPDDPEAWMFKGDTFRRAVAAQGGRGRRQAGALRRAEGPAPAPALSISLRYPRALRRGGAEIAQVRRSSRSTSRRRTSSPRWP